MEPGYPTVSFPSSLGEVCRSGVGMGEPRLNKDVGAQERSVESGERLSVPPTSMVKPTSALNRARATEDVCDDRYGLLPPEPPQSAREDSVML